QLIQKTMNPWERDLLPWAMFHQKHRPPPGMKSKYVRVLFSAPIFFLVLACGLNLARKDSCHEEMIKLLRHTKVRLSGPENAFDSHAKLPYMDSLLNLAHSTSSERRYCSYLKANILLELGREVEAIDILS